MYRTCALALALAGGCSKPVVFQGQESLAIRAAPPPPAPTPPPPRVEVRDNKIAITEKIQFEHDKAAIMAISFGLLDEIVAVIKKNPHIKKIQIEGHASSEGDARHNQKLSEDRAGSVMKYLTEHGVAPTMLIAKGYGIDQPIADNATEAGREQNRRVEFNIIDQEITKRRVEIDPSTGTEKMLDPNISTSKKEG
ncbi:MAG TPA: OmpA family protein [Kofleriaceae bacterium]